MQELLQGTCRHRTAPHQSVVGLDEEADRHQLNTHTHRWHDVVLTILLHRIGQVALAVEHLWLRRTIDVGIQHTYAEAHIAECEGEVSRNGRFTHAALARGYGDNLAHLYGCALTLWLWRTGRTLLDNHSDTLRRRRELLLKYLLHQRLDSHSKRIAALGEAQHHGDFILTRIDLLHHATIDYILLRLGMNNSPQRRFYFFLHISKYLHSLRSCITRGIFRLTKVEKPQFTCRK